MFTWTRWWRRYDCLTASISSIAPIRFTFAHSYTDQNYGKNESTNNQCHDQAEKNEKYFFCRSKTFIEFFMLSLKWVVKRVWWKFKLFGFEEIIVEQIAWHFCICTMYMWLCVCMCEHKLVLTLSTNTWKMEYIYGYMNTRTANNNKIMSRVFFCCFVAVVVFVCT